MLYELEVRPTKGFPMNNILHMRKEERPKTIQEWLWKETSTKMFTPF